MIIDIMDKQQTADEEELTFFSQLFKTITYLKYLEKTISVKTTESRYEFLVLR